MAARLEHGTADPQSRDAATKNERTTSDQDATNGGEHLAAIRDVHHRHL
jgi:hypothetical protein